MANEIQTTSLTDSFHPQELAISENRPQRQGNPSLPSMVKELLSFASYHAYSIWLFTYTDLKTIVFPSTIFGISNALAAGAYDIDVSIVSQLHVRVLLRTPLVLLWVWANLLPFAINNQRSSLAIAEDGMNKPWRPFPSARMSPRDGKQLMLVSYLAAQSLSLLLECSLRQSLALVFLGIWYNNYGGSDVSPFIRNLINAFGYICFTYGAMEVALGERLPLQMGGKLGAWFLIIAGIVLSTVHAQDMYDQEGDAVRGRRTVPLVVGDGAARWSIALFMLVWGFVCPYFWGSNLMVACTSVALSQIVALRTLILRDVASDRKTFRFWNLWMSLVYVLPLCNQMHVGRRWLG